MILAEITNQFSPPAQIAGWLACLAFTMWIVNLAWKLADRFTGKPPVPQPMNVEIVKALHEQFADKKVFDELVKHNTKRHGELFGHIARVETAAREAMEDRFTALNTERKETLEKLNDQFTFIREHIAAINRELQLKSRS